MTCFTLIFFKVIPLYLNIVLGYVAGKWLDANRDTIARILFFIVAPVVVFNGVIHTQLNFEVLLLPLLIFAISSGLCLVFYWLSRNIWEDSSRNLVAFSAGTGNTGYFGLPIALLFFDDQGEGIYIMAFLGMTLYENSVGYYIFAKGVHTASECVWKLIKLPTLHALIAGLIFNLLDLPISDVLVEFVDYMKGAYTVLGMMIIGLGLSTIKSFKLDFKFIGMTFLAKFVAWPLIIFTVIACDAAFFGLFNTTIYNALVLISIVPLAANTVVLASLFKSQPDKAAAAVVLSILFALVYVPVMTTFFIR